MGLAVLGMAVGGDVGAFVVSEAGRASSGAA
jgi:hypothetical protein